jgi:hypothetical protein
MRGGGLQKRAGGSVEVGVGEGTFIQGEVGGEAAFDPGGTWRAT